MLILLTLLLSQQVATDLQSAVDSLAGRGGTITLTPGAVYQDVSIVLPYDLRYQNIKIIGARTQLVAKADGSPILHVAKGWKDWAAPKLKGIEIHGIDFIAGQVVLDFTDGTCVQDCRFDSSPQEALVTGGGGSSRNSVVSRCSAINCGRKWSAGGLAAYNLNGYGDSLEFSAASSCGAGAEIGGTKVRVRHCTFADAPIKIGSAVHGCSDIEISRSTLERSSVDVGNGIGKLSDVRFIDNTCTDSPIAWTGAATTNRATAPGLPFSDRTSLVMGNTFVGKEAARITAWDKSLPTPEIRVVGNRIEAPARGGVIVQGRIAAPIAIEDNYFASVECGVAWLRLPNGELLPDDTNQLRFSRNRAPAKAFMTVNNGSAEWRLGVN